MLTLITSTHIFACVILISLVLLQQGKGADAGATFGGGGQTMFGASGADTLLTKVTAGIAIAFMITSILLAVNTKKVLSAESGLAKELAGEQEKASQATQIVDEKVLDDSQAEAGKGENPTSAEENAAPVATSADSTTEDATASSQIEQAESETASPTTKEAPEAAEENTPDASSEQQ